MKKIIAMAAMLSAVVVFAYTYRLQTLAWLQLPAFAVTEKDISDTLKNDEDPGEDKDVLSMRSCTEDEALYRRANRYYIGDKKDSVDISYPLFAQEGTALYYLNSDLSLITNDFEAYEPYDGLLLSNGKAYDLDGQTAEDEEYILSTAGKGLYINAQPMTIASMGNKTNIRLNSIMYLGDDGVHFYSYDDGKLVYGQTKVNYGDTVSIGSVTMTYDEFLKQLGLVAEYTTTERKEPETQETEANLQDNSREDRRNSGSSGDHANGETVADGESAAAAEIPVTIAEGENRTAEDETGEYLDTNNNGAGDGDTYDDPSANESGDEGNGGDSGSGNGDGSTGGGGGSSNGGSGSGSGGSNGGGTSGSSGSNNSGHGNGSNSGNAGSNGGNSDNGSGDNSGDGDNGADTGDGNNSGGDSDIRPDEFKEPTATLTDIEMGVYGMKGTLQIEDEQKHLVRAVFRFSVNGTQKSRKNMKKEGTLEVTNLEPGTTYQLTGELVFRNEKGVKVTKPFMDAIEITTLPMATLRPMRLTFTERDTYLPSQIGINKILAEDIPTSDGRITAIPYISRITVTIGGQEYNVGGNVVRNIKKGTSGDWLSKEGFDSNKTYNYTVKVVDRFRNEFELTSDSITKGTTHTSKVEPTAALRETGNAVGVQTVTAQITNQDHAAMENCYLYVVNTDGEDVPAFADTGDTINTSYRRAVSTDGKTNEFTITSLPSGMSFYIVVRADYDLNDKTTENWQRNIQLGRLPIYTAPISLLGNAYVNLDSADITDSSFTVGLQVDTNKTMEGLLTLMDRFPIEITAEGKIWKDETLLSRNELEKIPVAAGSTSVVIQDHDSADAKVPKVVFSGDAPESDTNAWEMLVKGWRVELQFREGEGQDNPFDSMTTYTVSVGAIAAQGGSEYKVQATTNTLQIRTIKQTASMKNDGVFTLSDFVEIYHFYFDDPDGAIEKGNITAKLYSVSEASLVETRTLKVNTEYESLRFNNLKMNNEYRIEFTAQNYNVYYESGKGEQNYTFLAPNVIYFKTGEGITGSLDLKSIVAKGVGWSSSVTVTLADRKKELKNGKYTLLLKGADGMDVESSKLKEIKRIDFDFPYDTAGESGISKVESFDCEGFWTYEVDLLISVRGYEDIVLAKVDFTTETGMETISNWSEFCTKLKANPTGKFAVVADIERDSSSRVSSFGGTVDFQGHSLTWPDGSNYTAAIGTLQSTGVIKNVVFNYQRTTSGNVSQTGGLVWANFGTIRNLVMTVKLGNIRPNYSEGFVAYTNRKSGVIENFSIKIEKELHAKTSIGIVTSWNSGKIRRGVVYGKNVVMESTVYGGDKTVSSGNFGAIAYSNEATGVVEDVFTLMNTVVEYNDSTWSMNRTAGIIGSNSGIVRNSFFVGDNYYYTYEDNKQSAYKVYNNGGSTVGANGATGRTTDLYHVSQQNEAEYPKDLGTSTLVQRLWDGVWYEKVFENPDQFEIEGQLSSGYYPKVKMDDCMATRQENIALPPAPGADVPDYVSSRVVSQTNREAELLLYYRSNNLQKITGVTFDGLTTEVLDQYIENGMYVVRVRVSNPQSFSGKYLYTSITYEINAANHETTTSERGQDGQYAEIDFYREIANFNDWLKIGQALGDNYILVSDLDFSGKSISSMQIGSDRDPFTGKLYGDGHTIRNISGVGSSVLSVLSGAEVKDLNFENVELITNDSNDNKAKSLEAGIFGKVLNNSTLKNIRASHVKLSDMPNHVGGLVSYLEYSTMEDCRTEDVSITTAVYGGKALSAGGLTGYGKGIKIYNCYASNLDLKAQKGNRADGIGGLVGYVDTFGTIENVYTHGKISTSFGGTGGVLGAGSSDVGQAMSYVSITSTTGDAGGILGTAYSTVSVENTISIGNISTGGSKIGRIYGSTTSTIVECGVTNGAAYSGQIVGTAISGDQMDATYLSNVGELTTEGFYRNRGRLGNSFDIEGSSGYRVEEGYLPQLKSVSGEVLADQTPIELPDENLKVTQARIFEFSGKYIVEVLAENGGNGFLLDHIECEGLDFERAVKTTQESPMGLKYDDVRPVKYQSVYPAVAVFRKGDATRRLEIQIRVEDGTVIARVIYNAEQWVAAMTEAGQNFENFKIEGDIDLTNYAKTGKLPMGLKINSLTGGSKSGGEKYTISGGNVSYSTSSPAESMFTTISGGIRNLRFANITLDNGTKAGTNFGLIASNQGTIDNCEFESIKLSGYQASQVGMIGSNSGSVTNIRLKNINVSTTASMNYVGGLIGYNTGTVKHVEAEGDEVNYTSMEDMPSGSLFHYQVTAASGSYVGGIIGITKTAVSDLSIKGAYVKGSSYTGGIAGQIAPAVVTENITVGESGYPVYISGSSRTAGVGYHNRSESTDTGYLKNAKVRYTYISGGSYTSGVIMGDWYYYVQNALVDHCYIKGTGGETHGTTGSGTGVQQSLVVDSKIEGTSNVSGIGRGQSSSLCHVTVKNTVIKGSGDYIGGIFSNTSAQEGAYDAAVIGCTIEGTGTTSKGIGGIVGRNEGTGAPSCYFVVNDTTVKGVTGVGGIVGIAIGGSYNYINCNATVEATGSGAGAFAGILYDYYFDNRGYISSEHAKVNEAVFGGSVTAGEQAGAFVGRLTYSSPKKDSNGDVVDFGNDYLDSKNYHRIILTSDVTAKNNIAVWGTFYLDPTEYTDTDSTYLKPTNSLDGDAIRNTGTAPQSVVWGGLKLNGTPLWGDNGSNIANYTGSGKPYAELKLTANTTDPTKMDDPKAAEPYLYFATDAAVFGRETLYKSLLGFNSSVWNCKHITADETRQASFPYLVYGEDMYPDPENTEKTTRLLHYQDGTLSWGVPIPTGATTSTLSLRDITDEQYLWVSASGPASITLELSSDVVGAAMSVADGSGEVLRVDNTTERVYTMPYNYSTPLVVTLSAPEIGFTQTYDILAQDLASSVMAWKGDQYYLTNSGIRSASGKSIAGSFLNLRNGQALDLNGDIWNVESGSVVSHCDFTDIQWEEPKAVCEFTYDGEKLSVYHQFIHYDGEDLDRLAYVKNGTLFGLEPDPDMVYGAVLADTYQDSQYLTVLGTDGLLHDLNESIHLPEGFTNRGIVELADNMHDDSHIAIGRYEDGKVFAFNYLTGTELTLEEADSWENGTDLSLADYAGQYLESYLGSWFGMNNSGYAASVNLMTNLSAGRLGSLDDILSYTGTASEGGEAAGTSGKAGGNGSAADSDSNDPDKKNSSSDHNEKDASTQSGDGEKSRKGIVDAVKSLFSKTADDEKNGVSTSKDETSESKKEKTNGTDEAKDEKDTVTKKNSSGENDADASKDPKEKTVQDGSDTSKNENAANDQTENRELTEKDAAASLSDLTEKQETADKSHAEKNGSEKDSAADSESVASGEKVNGEKASDDLTSDQDTTDGSKTGTEEIVSEAAGNSAGLSGASEVGIRSTTGTIDSAIGSENSGTSASAESKETEAVENAAEAESTAGSETEAASETVENDPTSSAVTEKKLITVYNPADGSYQVYTAKDYLSQSGDSLTSVDSKVKEMASQGLIADQTQLKNKDFMEDKKYGIMIFGAFSAMGILLSLGLLLKKREGRK